MPDSPLLFPSSPWVIKPLVPDEVYTDRAEFLEYFCQEPTAKAEGLSLVHKPEPDQTTQNG